MAQKADVLNHGQVGSPNSSQYKQYSLCSGSIALRDCALFRVAFFLTLCSHLLTLWRMSSREEGVAEEDPKPQRNVRMCVCEIEYEPLCTVTTVDSCAVWRSCPSG